LNLVIKCDNQSFALFEVVTFDISQFFA